MWLTDTVLVKMTINLKAERNWTFIVLQQVSIKYNSTIQSEPNLIANFQVMFHTLEEAQCKSK